MKEQIQKMWERFSQYKETAEQHEFVQLAWFDVRLTAQYEDLQKNWTDDHARLFIKNLTFAFKTLGINY